MPGTGEDCWRIERANRLAVIVDAERYFRMARRSMLKARRRIMLIGWDFDARIVLDHDVPDGDEPRTVGEFIYWLVERTPELEVHLLRWDVGALKALVRGTTILTVLKWMRHPRIHTRLDGHHPTGASHHQKIVVIDDCFAFCGGIDMTGDRWDSRAHHDDDPHRVQPNGKPYKPWHDAIAALDGPASGALAELCRERWHRAGGDELAPVEDGEDCWPEGLTADFNEVGVAIARTIPEMTDQAAVHEVEAMFLAQIANVRRYLYVESQYFASRKIAEAIGKRLGEADGPEFVIVNPETAQGWLEPLAMDTARARLMEALRRRDVHGRLRMYHPVTAAGAPIYVHAKMLVADDRVFRLGSSNMNNRSLRLDTECDLAIEATDDAARLTIVSIRDDLIAEHLGVAPERVAETLAEKGSLIATIEALRGPGRSLIPYVVPDLTSVGAWLADNEVLDPEGPDEMFEAPTKRGLFRRWLRKPR